MSDQLLFAIQFGDHCPRAHSAGLNAGLVAGEQGEQEDQEASLCKLRCVHTRIPRTQHTKLLNYLKFIQPKSSNTPIFKITFIWNERTNNGPGEDGPGSEVPLNKEYTK